MLPRNFPKRHDVSIDRWKISNSFIIVGKMGDSDDEYDRKRRDKFRGERERGGGGERERWPERGER